ncbi:hypothetical protein FRX31_019774 [Thalictrum thalictroides]|uniref:Uncharacterized protein n=1 Tax=Thalictrum thalictroides TaxID=46969 RepID=A0A7J6VZT6_THATH|nr:hypothetical protein FRX31_019774 [Thalictrum thalictroides]
MHLRKVASRLAYEAAEENDTYRWMAEKLDELSKELKEHKQILKSGTTTVLGSNIVEETINDDSQSPIIDSQDPFDISLPTGDASQHNAFSQPLGDVTQTPLDVPLSTIGTSHIVLKNPNKAKTKGRPVDDHKSNSSRMKAGIETSRKRKSLQEGRQCKCCLLWGTGHDKRTCPQNPNRKKK